MSRTKMIIYAAIAIIVIGWGVSVRNHDLRASRQSAADATDRPEGGYMPGQEGTTHVGRVIDRHAR